MLLVEDLSSVWKELLCFPFISILNKSIRIYFSKSGCMHFEGEKYDLLKFSQEQKTPPNQCEYLFNYSFLLESGNTVDLQSWQGSLLFLANVTHVTLAFYKYFITAGRTVIA